MKPRLAQIDVLTARLDGKGDPTIVADVLEAATARAEAQAGRELSRATRTEYPHPVDTTRDLQLCVRPVESVTSIVQLSSPGSDADFDAGDGLEEYTDFYLDPRTGIVEHQNSYWQARRGLVRAVYIGGYLDPDGVPGVLDGAVSAGDSQFDIDLAVAAGDAVLFGTTGERVTVGSVAGAGPYTVTIASGGVLANDYADGVAVAHFPGEAVLPPNHLQEGIIQQAIWFYNTADTAGIQQVDFGEAGGQISYGQVKTHPHLITSVQKLPGRRLP